jgi:NAD(P)-dependent dehydrogenase (short-subunit alcohol dehydrogenase family)
MAETESSVALVTGASRGLGRAIAVALAAGGCDVAINYKDAATKDEAQDVVRAVAAAGQRAVAFQADVSEGAQVEQMFRDAEAAFGHLDFLVNNAGIARPETVFDISEESWKEVIDTNLTGCFLCARAALRRMAPRRRGRIVSISSVAGSRGHLCGQVHYAASKSGIIGLTKTLARTAAPYGIQVNAVAPGLIDTDLLRATHSPAELAELAREIPLGIGRPEDVASVVAFLLGEGGQYITGATIDVNGGAYMR